MQPNSVKLESEKVWISEISKLNWDRNWEWKFGRYKVGLLENHGFCRDFARVIKKRVKKRVKKERYAVLGLAPMAGTW